MADDGYIRESILKPEAKIVDGWEPIMPTYKGQLNEEEIIQLIAFIKSLRPGQTPVRTEQADAAGEMTWPPACRGNTRGPPGKPGECERHEHATVTASVPRPSAARTRAGDELPERRPTASSRGC